VLIVFLHALLLYSVLHSIYWYFVWDLQTPSSKIQELVVSCLQLCSLIAGAVQTSVNGTATHAPLTQLHN
jgi:hypothetical protein